MFLLPGYIGLTAGLTDFILFIAFICLYLDKWMKKHLKAIPVRLVTGDDEKKEA